MPSFVLNSYSYLQQRNLNLQHRTLPSKVHLSYEQWILCRPSLLPVSPALKQVGESREGTFPDLSEQYAGTWYSSSQLNPTYPERWNYNLHLQVKYKELTRP